MGFSYREESGSFFIKGLVEEEVREVQGMDEDGFLITG